MLNPKDDAENLEQQLFIVYVGQKFAGLNGILNLASQEGSPGAHHLYYDNARLVVSHARILDTAA
ncbi:hypothetical protein LMG26411_05877 [Cupriavidus numazuensis]|uniref:Uncharacterized protein n=1 Tax=Cupriavidus numazuensis TaxID=221992 RepID=A0ABN7Q5T5_9BURK|nr:hypothetical protein [Cupriavidus numazuensis]CAG2158197.1 hypothetical protein LMG26411_05877 [Cupriavidus numazuensis]